MSASNDAPPPIDNSDSGTNTTTNASNVLKSSGTAPLHQCQADAERREAKYHRQHRPAQDADTEHSRQCDGQRPEPRRAARQQLEAGGKGQTDRGGGNAVENTVDR
jgi:hypothetical protein